MMYPTYEPMTIQLATIESISTSTYHILYSIILAGLITAPLINHHFGISIVAFLGLFTLLYISFSNMNSDNRPQALPKTVYPPPPHTGLDGISLENRLTGLNIM